MTVWTEKAPAEDTPRPECPHDVVGLRVHKGTMWMSNDRVPLKNVESPYGGGVISYTLDSQLMEGITYLERSALGVCLDSGPTEGASCLEPLEQ